MTNRFIHRLFTDVAMIEPGQLRALVATAGDIRAGEHPSLKAVRHQLKPVVTKLQDGVAVVPIQGPLAHKPDAFEQLMGIEDSSKHQGDGRPGRAGPGRDRCPTRY